MQSVFTVFIVSEMVFLPGGWRPIPKKISHLKKILLLLVLGAVFTACTSETDNQQEAAEASPDKPNVVYILVDDLGYADIGCYGQEKI